MLLDHLKDFEWYNEPSDVWFNDDGMHVETAQQTDFWQAIQHNVQKDNGHFFFTRKTSDFAMTVHWKFESAAQFDQCGVMVRIDNHNWLKASIMYEDSAHPKICTSATNRGYSDLALIDIPEGIKDVWYRVKRIKGDYLVFYSLDGVNFKQIRLLHFISDMIEVKAGAFACSPHKKHFHAVIADIEI